MLTDSNVADRTAGSDLLAQVPACDILHGDKCYDREYSVGRSRAKTQSCTAQNDEHGERYDSTKNNDIADAAQMHLWMESVGGSIFLGGCNLKSVKESKDGGKITIILKKKKGDKEKKSETTQAKKITL
jgi:hypothetical protein